VQAAVAAPLVAYGVGNGRGFAFGIGLQAIEASVGIGIGLLFLAREGLSYATLKQMEENAAAGDLILDASESTRLDSLAPLRSGR